MRVRRLANILIVTYNFLHQGEYRMVRALYIPVDELVCQTVPTGMFFDNCSQNFHTHTGHLRKVAKAQKFALPLSEARVSAIVGLALVADQTSAWRFAIPFPHAIHSASNIHESFKCIILSNYAIIIAIDDTCKNQT